MTWLHANEILAGLIAEATAQLKQLGHAISGFAPSEPGVLTTMCTRCWEHATIRVRSWGRPTLSGAALILRCRPHPSAP